MKKATAIIIPAEIQDFILTTFAKSNTQRKATGKWSPIPLLTKSISKFLEDNKVRFASLHTKYSDGVSEDLIKRAFNKKSPFGATIELRNLLCYYATNGQLNWEGTINEHFVKHSSLIDKLKKEIEKAATKDDFSNTAWYLYYHEYIDDPKTPYTVITRLVLLIKDLKHIKLYERDENDDFVGYAELNSDTTSSTLIVHLKRESTSFKKELELRIILSGGISYKSIFLGQYMDFESGDKIVSGTFIIENVSGHSLNEKAANPYYKKSNYSLLRDDLKSAKGLKVIQIDLVYYSGWERYIPKPIAKYLSHKWKNHSKTKPVASTLKKLSDWLRDQKEQKPYEEYKFNTTIEYDFFIVTPVGNIKEITEKQYYKDINNFFFETPSPIATEIKIQNSINPIFDSKNSLKNIGINKIYYSPRVLIVQKPSFSGDEESHTIIDNDLKAMKQSRFVIFILPDKIHTSALIKIGWAMHQEKPIFVFPLKADILPKLLSKPYPNKIWLFDPMTIKVIPEKLIERKKDLKW